MALVTADLFAQQDQPQQNRPSQGQGRPQGQGGPPRGGFGGRGGPGGPGGGGELMLLANEKVQKELELIDDQIKDFEKLRDEQQTKMRDMFSGMRDLPEDQRRAKFEEMRGKLDEAQKELRAKLNGVLMPHQQDRLKELNIQFRGTAALDDPEVAAALKITDEQKKQIADVREQQGQKMREMFTARREGGNAGPDEETRNKFTQMQAETTEKLMAVLSAEQRAQFEKMKGEKFEFDRSQMGFGGRGGPGGPGGGRRPEGERRPAAETPAKNET